MDPHVVFDSQKVVPNRFALSLAAAARKRALNHGAERRVAGVPAAGNGDLALHEIAAAAFTPAELSTARCVVRGHPRFCVSEAGPRAPRRRPTAPLRPVFGPRRRSTDDAQTR
jgi:hypothetical protein